MGLVRLRVSRELIREVLRLPVTAVVVGSVETVGDVEILVDTPDVATPDGQIVDVSPVFRRNAGSVPDVEFVEWRPDISITGKSRTG